MHKCKITVLTPLHIGSGNEYESGFTMLQQSDYLYLYDEFNIAQFFIDNGMEIPTDLTTVIKQIKQYKDTIITSDLHFRKIETHFASIDKPLYEQVSSAHNPIVSGSSIKGAIRTAYINKLVKEGKFSYESKQLQKLDDEIADAYDYQTKKRLRNEKRKLLRKIQREIDKKTKSIFKYLKVSDSFEPLVTKVYKTINVKKDRTHQSNREDKVQNIANFVESIVPNQSFYIELDMNHREFQSLAQMCNDFYGKLYKRDFEYYFSNRSVYREVSLNSRSFLLNMGKFGGAEVKSIEEIRSLPKTGSDVEWETSARTFAIDQPPRDNVYFENELLPFGWILCEIMD